MSNITEALSEMLASVHRPGDFYAFGTVALLAPALEVAGFGAVPLPLLPDQAARLIGVAQAAPFGRGTQTLIDDRVRRSWQIGPDQVRIHGRHFEKTLADIRARAAVGLGVGDPVDAVFYKLLIYDKGSFFVSHRDTEKQPGMFATLVIALPSVSTGGDLVVRHMGREARLAMRNADPAEAVFAAFYADCVHEVLPVETGCRITLIYNLVRRGNAPPPAPPNHDRQEAKVAALLTRWAADNSAADDVAPTKLVYPLQHAYTPSELSFAVLKGADAAVAGVVSAAAQRAACDLHLALLTVEESGAAEYTGNYGSRGRYRDGDDTFEAGEIFDTSVTLSEWRRSDAKGKPLGIMPVEADELSPADILESLEPDDEEFHEATGNEGASFERTYRRAALVLWPRQRFLAVLAGGGLQMSLPWLEEMAGRSACVSGDLDSAGRADCLALAGHIIDGWSGGHSYRVPGNAESSAARMLGLLVQLDDPGLIESFLTRVVAAGAHDKGDAQAIIGALAHLPESKRQKLIERIVQGTVHAAFNACASLLARLAAAWPMQSARGLAAPAASLLAAMPSGAPRVYPAGEYWREPGIDTSNATDLLTVFCATDPKLALQAVDLMLAHPEIYGLDKIIIPVLRDRIGVRDFASSPAIARLKEACLQHLRARMAEPLEAPADWSRPAKLACKCPHCADLGRFLGEPNSRTHMLRAAEPARAHVEQSIRQAGCDIDTMTDRRGRPYTLVCTKNQASFDRRTKQRAADIEAAMRLAQ